MSDEPGLPAPDAVCDGGDLDCGSGLLLIIRKAMTPIDAGGVLEVRSREGSVREDLPAWCRLVGHGWVGERAGEGGYRSYFVRKKEAAAATAGDGGGTGAAAEPAADDLASDLSAARDFAWTVRVRWTEGMAARAFARNHAIEVGQPASFDTEDAAPSAIEHLLAGLGGCLAVGFQWRASRAGVAVRNLEVSLRAKADNILVFLGIEDEGHPGLAVVSGKLYVDADAEPDDLQDLWEETLRRSPVAQTIGRAVSVDVELEVM